MNLRAPATGTFAGPGKCRKLWMDLNIEKRERRKEKERKREREKITRTVRCCGGCGWDRVNSHPNRPYSAVV